MLIITSLLLAFTAGCRKAPKLEPVAVLRLTEHLVAKQRDVFTESLGGEVLWSDKAILERAKTLPGPLQALLDTSRPDAAIGEGVMGALLQDLERRSGEWRAASVQRRGTGDFDCAIGDDTVKAEVNCLYVNYLEARYPKGQYRVKAPLEPVLFLDGEPVRAVLMPLKR